MIAHTHRNARRRDYEQAHADWNVPIGRIEVLSPVPEATSSGANIVEISAPDPKHSIIPTGGCIVAMVTWLEELPTIFIYMVVSSIIIEWIGDQTVHAMNMKDFVSLLHVGEEVCLSIGVTLHCRQEAALPCMRAVGFFMGSGWDQASFFSTKPTPNIPPFLYRAMHVQPPLTKRYSVYMTLCVCLDKHLGTEGLNSEWSAPNFDSTVVQS